MCVVFANAYFCVPYIGSERIPCVFNLYVGSANWDAVMEILEKCSSIM